MIGSPSSARQVIEAGAGAARTAALFGAVAAMALAPCGPVRSAERIAVELTSSRALADLLIVPTQLVGAPRAYIGPCRGDHSRKRLRILITDNRYEDGAREVRLTERHRADVLFCTRR